MKCADGVGDDALEEARIAIERVRGKSFGSFVFNWAINDYIWPRVLWDTSVVGYWCLVHVSVYDADAR